MEKETEYVDTAIPENAATDDRDRYQEFLARCCEHKLTPMSFADWKDAWEDLQERIKYGYPA